MDAVGIPTLLTVDDGARFTSVVPPYQGLHVFEANRPIIRDLHAAGSLVREDSYVHSYPHCWRCRNPLIYKAVSSWFVEVTRIRDRMVELNEQITWVPEHVKQGSWAIGCRTPGLVDQPEPLRAARSRSGDRTTRRIHASTSTARSRSSSATSASPYRICIAYIDQLTRPNPDNPTGRSSDAPGARRMDVWFDSGSMSFAKVHYPFENTDWFEHHFPGDFIVEYIGQTRGGSTPCTCCRRRCSTGRRSRPA